MGTMKTPGVYIVEKDAFPNSVVEVETAIPAFVGYTEFARKGQKTITNQAVRISSMAEYEKFFGGKYNDTFVLNAIKAPTARAARGGAAANADPAPPPENAAALTGDEINIDGTNYLLERSKFSPKYLMYRSMQMFFLNGGGVCYVVSVGDYKKDEPAAGAISKDELLAGIEKLVKVQEPTMLVVPEAIALADNKQCALVQNQMVKHCGSVMKNRIAILDVYDGNKSEQDNKCISNFRKNMTEENLDFAAAYYPWINTGLVDVTSLDFDSFSSHKDEDETNGRAKFLSLIKAEFTKIANDPSIAEDQKEAAKAVFAARDAMLKEVKAGIAPKRKLDIAKSLYVNSDVYKMVLSEVQVDVNEMATSAAIAGVYTQIDNNIAVWKAPANCGIQGMNSPTVEISHLEQQNLNVDLDGKSINAIRTINGPAKVWGARTLDGNSLDWRYISVRRTIIMIEQSIKFAANAYVFEANDGQTWVTMRSMINNFLTGIWKRGGLAGAIPKDAFQVNVGLGETMTATDILEGILRITVLIAVTRPAEFIEITFQQQQQKS